MKSLATKKDLDVCMKWPQFESALKHGSVESGGTLTGSPSEGVVDTIKQLGTMVEGHDNVLKNIHQLQVKVVLHGCKLFLHS